MTVEKSHFQFIFNKLLRIMRARSDEKLIHENGFSLLATFSEASPLRRRAFERFSSVSSCFRALRREIMLERKQKFAYKVHLREIIVHKAKKKDSAVEAAILVGSELFAFLRPCFVF